MSTAQVKATKAAYYKKHAKEIQAKVATYQAAHPEETKARKAAWYLAHAPELKAKAALYQAAHPEQHKASVVKYDATHQEERKAYRAAHAEEKKPAQQAYYVANRPRIQAHNATRSEERHVVEAAWRKAHPEIKQVLENRRRARKANAPVCDFTAAQWIALQAAYDHRCVYCGKRRKGKLTQDHVQPLSQGGSHTLSNIVPACRNCNSKKYTGPPLAPIQQLLF